MPQNISDIAFSPAVKAWQEQEGSRAAYEQMMSRRDWKNKVSPILANFIAELDSFYMGTANSEGQPYIQHRGGPKGFLKVIDDETLAFADYAGNRQYISMGNLSENNKVHLFLMDYPNRFRIKIWGEARVSQDPQILAQVKDPYRPGKVERAVLIKIKAWDANCPQHITPRYTVEQLASLEVAKG